MFTKAAGNGSDVIVLNDADAAGIAEARFGAAKGVAGVVIMLTFGTGIGSALLINGKLVPNTELGHLELDGYDAETRAAASVRDEHGMSYKKWAKRVNELHGSTSSGCSRPDLFVVGGGVSKDADKWVPLLELNTPVKPAQLLNNAGIVGAAMAARRAPRRVVDGAARADPGHSRPSARAASGSGRRSTILTRELRTNWPR